MYQDDEDVEYLQEEDRLANESLERVGGVFVEPERSQVDCNQEEAACAPDDYPEDPYAIDNRPGTVDDVGYSYGLQTTDANDISFGPEGKAVERGEPAPATERDLELGQLEADDLWQRQEDLIEEDEDDGIKIPLGMNEEDGERIMGAMGDDSGDESAEGIAGNSATGEATTNPPHGGFPERDDG